MMSQLPRDNAACVIKCPQSSLVIVPYGAEPLYLFVLGVATGPCAIFNLDANWRSAVMLSAGTVIAGFSLFTLFATYTDLLSRCLS